MKITQLQTLEQFIDFIENYNYNKKLGNEFIKYYLILSYKKLLSKPITNDISDELKLINNILVWETSEYKTLGGHFKNWKDVAAHMTLKDLAEKTGGKLKVKNLEI